MHALIPRCANTLKCPQVTNDIRYSVASYTPHVFGRFHLYSYVGLLMGSPDYTSIRNGVLLSHVEVREFAKCIKVSEKYDQRDGGRIMRTPIQDRFVFNSSF